MASAKIAHEASSNVAPAPSAAPDHSRDEAVDRYAQFIRDCPNISFIELDGEVRVDPRSAPDWRISVEAFQDAQAVREAIAYRCARRKDHEDGLEKRRERIRSELRAGNLKVRQEGNRWLITGEDKWLAAAATAMQEHPELAGDIEENARATLISDQSASREVSVRERAETVTPSVMPAQFKQTGPSPEGVEIAEDGYTCEQQTDFLKRQGMAR
jgi:hypothetical protein